jgi:hypothetical protein
MGMRKRQARHTHTRNQHTIGDRNNQHKLSERTKEMRAGTDLGEEERERENTTRKAHTRTAYLPFVHVSAHHLTLCFFEEEQGPLTKLGVAHLLRTHRVPVQLW